MTSTPSACADPRQSRPVRCTKGADGPEEGSSGRPGDGFHLCQAEVRRALEGGDTTELGHYCGIVRELLHRWSDKSRFTGAKFLGAADLDGGFHPCQHSAVDCEAVFACARAQVRGRPSETLHLLVKQDLYRRLSKPRRREQVRLIPF